MKLSIIREDLLKELQLLQGILGQRNSMPILANLLVETTPQGTVKLFATDLDTSLRCETPVSIIEEGSALVPARKFFDIVRSLPEGCEILLQREGNDWVEVEAGRARFRLASPPTEAFPTFPTIEESSTVEIDAGHLRTMIKQTIFAIYPKAFPYVMSGAKFICTPELARMVSTDGHRLSIVEIAGLAKQSADSQTIDTIIPRKALAELARLTSIYEGPVKISMAKSTNHIQFELGERLLIARLLDGQYPNYELVLPKEYTKKVRLECALFTESLRRVALMADGRSQAVRLTFAPNTLQISAQSAEEGFGEEILTVDYDGEQTEIGFNAQYLQDFLLTVKEGEISFEFNNDTEQALLRPVEQNGTNYRYIVMPLRVLS